MCVQRIWQSIKFYIFKKAYALVPKWWPVLSHRFTRARPLRSLSPVGDPSISQGSLVGQWVKDLDLSLLWLRSLVQSGFVPCPRNFCMP